MVLSTESLTIRMLLRYLVRMSLWSMNSLASLLALAITTWANVTTIFVVVIYKCS